MDFQALRTIRSDPDRFAAFHHDTLHGSQLNLDLATVAEGEILPSRSAGEGEASDLGSPRSDKEPRVKRRADKLQLACEFNLREGICSPFRIVRVEELHVEERIGGFHDE